MSTYVFKAIDLAGGKARGEVEADSKQAVSDQLKQRGLIVLDISDKHSSRQIELQFMKRVKANDLAIAKSVIELKNELERIREQMAELAPTLGD